MAHISEDRVARQCLRCLLIVAAAAVLTLTQVASSGLASCVQTSSTFSIFPPRMKLNIGGEYGDYNGGGFWQFRTQGIDNRDVEWSVSGIVGGNEMVGTVVDGNTYGAGDYTSPATLPNPPYVTLRATNRSDPSDYDEITIALTDQRLRRVLNDLSHSFLFLWHGPMMNEYLAWHHYLRTTTRFESLSSQLVDNYDLVVIPNAHTNVPFLDYETQALVDFVVNGGGLLLVGEKPIWENRPLEAISGDIYEMNLLANQFGLQFGDIATPPFSIYPNDITSGVSTSDLSIDNAGLVENLSGLHTVLVQDANSNPVVIAKQYGAGRVAIIGDIDFIGNRRNEEFFLQLNDWLSADMIAQNLDTPVPSDADSDNELPIYDGDGRTLALMRFTNALAGHPNISYMGDIFPQVVKINTDLMGFPHPYSPIIIDFVTAGGYSYIAGDESVIGVALLTTPEDMIGIAAHEVLGPWHYPRTIVQPMGEATSMWTSTETMYRLGGKYASSAQSTRQWHDNNFRAVDPAGTELDITTFPYQQPAQFGKAQWIYDQLRLCIDEDFFSRYFRHLQDNLEVGPALLVNEAIYWLSEANQRNLFPFFTEIGTTVHPEDFPPLNYRPMYLKSAHSSRQAPSVLFDESHSEWVSIEGNLTSLADDLRELGYSVEGTATTPTTLDMLSNYDAYVIGTAWAGFSSDEVEATTQFVNQGGGLLLTGVGWSWVNPSLGRTIDNFPMNVIASQFGIKILEDGILDPSDYYPGGSPANPTFHDPANHPSTNAVQLVGGPIGPSPLQRLREGPVAVVFGDQDAYSGGGHYTAGDRPPLVMVAEQEEGRVAVIGHEGYFVDVDYDGNGTANIDDYDNRQLALSILGWLAGPVLPSDPLDADLDCDCDVDVTDTLKIAGFWPTAVFEPDYRVAYDVDGDSDIDILDVQKVAYHWGAQCSETSRLTSSAKAQHQEAVLAVHPSTHTVQVGQTLAVSLVVSGALDLGAFEFTMEYSPDVVEVTSVVLGSFPGSVGRTFTPVGLIISPTVGTVAFGAYSLGMAPQGPSGDGVLAVLNMRALAQGESELDFIAAQVGDPAGNPQTPLSTSNGRVRAESSCPEIANTPYFTHYYNNVIIEDAPAPAGAIVTALSPREDVVGCFEVITPGLYGYMRVYGEDTSVSPPVPGMRPGEPVAFEVNGECADTDPSPVLWQDDKRYHAVDLTSPCMQRIPLHGGWNWFSTNHMPPDSSVPAVLTSIVGKFDLVLGEDGVYAPPPANPAFNTLTDILAGDGYMIHMTQAAQEPDPLLVTGPLVLANTPIALHSGWNWFGYLPESAQDVSYALSSIAAKYDLVLGELGTYAPPPANPAFNTLTRLEPGRGYLTHMTLAGTVVYPIAASAGQRALTTQPVQTCDVPTTPFFTHYYGDVTIEGLSAPVGAIVEALSLQGDVVGCFEVATAGLYGYMRVYGEDTSVSPPVPGMRAGEEVAFRVNGVPAIPAPSSVIWQDDKGTHEVHLSANGHTGFLPLIVR